MMKTLLQYSLYFLVILQVRSNSTCRSTLESLDSNFTCGNDVRACNTVTVNDECSMYCCPKNESITVNKADIEHINNVEDKYIKPNTLEYDFEDFSISFEIESSIYERDACNPNLVPKGNLRRSDDMESVDHKLSKKATRHCANCGYITRDKYGPRRCAPYYSRKYRSAHNCKRDSGKTYLCVQGGVATCYNIEAAVSLNFEGGECFL